LQAGQGAAEADEEQRAGLAFNIQPVEPAGGLIDEVGGCPEAGFKVQRMDRLKMG